MHRFQVILSLATRDMNNGESLFSSLSALKNVLKLLKVLSDFFILKLKNCQKEYKNYCPGKCHVISLKLGNKNGNSFICLFNVSFDSISNLAQMFYGLPCEDHCCL